MSSNSSVKPALARRRRGQPSDAIIALVVVVAAFALHFATDLFGGLERRYYDFASTRSDRTPSDRVAIIAIDDESIANIGRWPWPREVHARLIDQLAAAGAKTVAHTAFLFEPQTDRGLTRLRDLRVQLLSGDASVPAWADLGPEARQRLQAFIDTAEQDLDTDARLVNSLGQAGNVVVPSLYVLGEPQGRPDQPLPAFAQKSAVPDTQGFGVAASAAQQPLEAIGQAALAVAHLNQLPDRDGTVRGEPLLLHFDSHGPETAEPMLAALKEPEPPRGLKDAGKLIGNIARARNHDLAVPALRQQDQDPLALFLAVAELLAVLQAGGLIQFRQILSYALVQLLFLTLELFEVHVAPRGRCAATGLRHPELR
mgnify:CR=1 FL=1